MTTPTTTHTFIFAALSSHIEELWAMIDENRLVIDSNSARTHAHIGAAANNVLITSQIAKLEKILADSPDELPPTPAPEPTPEPVPEPETAPEPEDDDLPPLSNVPFAEWPEPNYEENPVGWLIWRASWLKVSLTRPTKNGDVTSVIGVTEKYGMRHSPLNFYAYMRKQYNAAGDKDKMNEYVHLYLAPTRKAICGDRYESIPDGVWMKAVEMGADLPAPERATIDYKNNRKIVLWHDCNSNDKAKWFEAICNGKFANDHKS